MAGARHSMCELTRHGMAWARHGVCKLVLSRAIHTSAAKSHLQRNMDAKRRKYWAWSTPQNITAACNKECCRLIYNNPFCKWSTQQSHTQHSCQWHSGLPLCVAISFTWDVCLVIAERTANRETNTEMTKSIKMFSSTEMLYTVFRSQVLHSGHQIQLIHVKGFKPFVLSQSYQCIYHS
jgi:hypothetical protein